MVDVLTFPEVPPRNVAPSWTVFGPVTITAYVRLLVRVPSVVLPPLR